MPSNIVPNKCKFDVNNNFMPTAASKAHPAAFIPLTAPFTVLLVLNLSKTLATIETIINDGKITAVVASNAPKIPDVVNPAKVATFTPTGPGVIDATANISVNCFEEYQWNLSAISYKNGKNLKTEKPPLGEDVTK